MSKQEQKFLEKHCLLILPGGEDQTKFGIIDLCFVLQEEITADQPAYFLFHNMVIERVNMGKIYQRHFQRADMEITQGKGM